MGDDGSGQTVKIAVLGAGGVGKSSLTIRFIRNIFVSAWSPTIEDEYRKAVSVDDVVSILHILDTAGQDEFTTMRAQWMTDKDG